MRSPFIAERIQGRDARGFWRDSQGNIAILFALFMVPALVLIGLAIDGLRALNAAETAANAADAAALAAARAMVTGNMDDNDVVEEAARFFEANARGGGKVSYSSYSDLEITPNRETGEVTVAVTAHVPTTFGRLAYIDKLSMRREATAMMGVGDVDIGLMLDVTGSMDENGKLEALQEATALFVDTVIPEGPYADRVRVALAPYSTQVNMGFYADRMSNGPNDSGCVVERENGNQNDDSAPVRNNLFHVLTDDEKAEFKDVRKEPPACPDAEILPLTSNKGALMDTVDGYKARGYTAGHLGIQWAWNLISDKWSGVWPGESRPKPNAGKVVVLMTDGEFNSAFTGRISDRAMRRESYSHAKELCDSMKAEKIVIFSIAFDLDDRDARRALADCATPDGGFLEAENKEQLKKAYKNIAIKITQLRLSK